MRHALVFGGSGQIGAALVERLLRAGWTVDALSRQVHQPGPGVRWLRGDFATLPPLPRACDAIISCGPLDLFSSWYARAHIDCPRVVAFGSTSIETKRAATSAAERALAQRLLEAEARVHGAAADRVAAATLLRPTLVYGAGRDSNLSRIAAMARRTGFFLLPSGANGMRQPVHVGDLATAACTAAGRSAGAGGDYALPGGEALAYRDMVARVLASLRSAPRLIEVPAPLFAIVLAAGRATGRLHDLPDGAVARMREDLVFDAGPAHRDLGYAPRPFLPTPEMFDGVPG